MCLRVGEYWRHSHSYVSLFAVEAVSDLQTTEAEPQLQVVFVGRLDFGQQWSGAKDITHVQVQVFLTIHVHYFLVVVNYVLIAGIRNRLKIMKYKILKLTHTS